MSTLTIGRHTIHHERPVSGDTIQCYATTNLAGTPVIRCVCTPDRTNVLCWRDVPFQYATEATIDAAIAALTADILTARDVREGRP